MTVAMKEQEELFRKLVMLARGDRELVWKAIRRHADADGMAPLDKVVEEIKDQIRLKQHGSRKPIGSERIAV